MDIRSVAPMRRLTVDEAAYCLGVSKSYLNKLRCTGGGPHYAKLGSRIVYTLADIDAWANARRRISTSDNKKDAAHASS